MLVASAQINLDDSRIILNDERNIYNNFAVKIVLLFPQCVVNCAADYSFRAADWGVSLAWLLITCGLN